MNECHPETSPTNLDARQSRQVPDRQDLESNTDTSFIHRKQEDDERRERTLTALRRRYKRREASSFGPDLEEGKGSNLPSINSVDQEAKLHDASLFEPISNAHTIETTPTDATETGISQRNLPLSIMHRSNFNRKPDDKLREKFKNLIRSSAEGATETQLLANAKSMAEDGAKHDAVRENRIDHPLPIVHHSNYIRKPDDKLREKFRNIRSPADGIPEVHIVGELSEGTGFKDTYVSCKW